MSGHSKWSQIRHKKAATDQKRARLFSKLAKAITLAALNGIDPKMNPALASAIEQARRMNMPNDNIERAIKKVSDKAAAQLEKVVVEALGPGGTALRIIGVTDSKNRTIAEIKKILGDNGAKMVQPGSISWMLDVPVPKLPDVETKKLDALLDALDNQDDVEDVIVNLKS